MTSPYLTRRLRTEAQALADLSAAERRHDGPLPAGTVDLDAIAERRRAMRRDRIAVLKADAILAREHLDENRRWLRQALHRLLELERQPASPQRDRQLRFAKAAVQENREKVRHWRQRLLEAHAELAAAQPIPQAAE